MKIKFKLTIKFKLNLNQKKKKKNNQYFKIRTSLCKENVDLIVYQRKYLYLLPSVIALPNRILKIFQRLYYRKTIKE